MAVDHIGFRPDATDRRILDEDGNSPTKTIRYALRLLDHQKWLDQFYQEAQNQKDWDPNTEAEAW